MIKYSQIKETSVPYRFSHGETYVEFGCFSRMETDHISIRIESSVFSVIQKTSFDEI